MPIEERWLSHAVIRCLDSLESRRLAVDVGANVGDWTVELAKVFERVISFEPDSRLSLPELDNVTLHRGVVSDTCGKLSLYLRPDPGQNSLLVEHPIGGGGGAPAPVMDVITVPAITLDEACPDGADFVKIDVEGAEVAVLRGCERRESWERTVFVVECHDTRRGVAEELWRLGKTLQLIRHPDTTAHREHCWIIAEPPH
jgi:FkbM family methyltransferase